MKIATFRFGEIEIDEEKIVSFPQGIPGFEHIRKFIFLEAGADLPISIMQSVDDGDVSLIVTNPFLFYPEYEFTIPEITKQELGIQAVEDVAVWSIITVKDSLKDATLNLLAPVVVNIRTKIGRQLILQGSGYQIRHPLLREMKPNESAKG